MKTEQQKKYGYGHAPIGKETHNRLKAYCALNDLRQWEVLTKIVEEFLAAKKEVE